MEWDDGSDWISEFEGDRRLAPRWPCKNWDLMVRHLLELKSGRTAIYLTFTGDGDREMLDHSGGWSNLLVHLKTGWREATRASRTRPMQKSENANPQPCPIFGQSSRTAIAAL
jgi:hypothetical protein